MSRRMVALALGLVPACASSYGSVYVPVATTEVDVHSVAEAALARVPVLESGAAGPSEVVAAVDVHERPGRQDEALRALRAQAAALGAEAVVGVEFHHGDDGKPTHLSGLAVRFRDLLQGRS